MCSTVSTGGGCRVTVAPHLSGRSVCIRVSVANKSKGGDTPLAHTHAYLQPDETIHFLYFNSLMASFDTLSNQSVEVNFSISSDVVHVQVHVLMSFLPVPAFRACTWYIMRHWRCRKDVPTTPGAAGRLWAPAPVCRGAGSTAPSEGRAAAWGWSVRWSSDHDTIKRAPTHYGLTSHGAHIKCISPHEPDEEVQASRRDNPVPLTFKLKGSIFHQTQSNGCPCLLESAHRISLQTGRQLAKKIPTHYVNPAWNLKVNLRPAWEVTFSISCLS